MRRLFTLLQRELSVFYYSPIAYIVLFFFLILNGLSFWFAIALLNRAPSEVMANARVQEAYLGT